MKTVFKVLATNVAMYLILLLAETIWGFAITINITAWNFAVVRVFDGRDDMYFAGVFGDGGLRFGYVDANTCPPNEAEK